MDTQKKMILIFVLLPLVLGILSGMHTRKTIVILEYTPEILEKHADEILDKPVTTPKRPVKPVYKALAKRPDVALIEPDTRATSQDLPDRGKAREQRNVMEFEATAYDLSVASCGKPRSHSEYGVTASGLNISGKGIKDRFVAADKKYFPFDTKIYIEFPDSVRYMKFGDEEIDLNGVYTVVDRGGAIKGKRVDIFFGEDKARESVIHDLCYKFGRQKVKVSEVKSEEG